MRTESKASWLVSHLEEFVKPVLGYIPNLPKDYTRFFTPQEMSVIKNMWRTVKRESLKKPVLLAGRDVFVFEILARREGFPTTFRPDISRKTVAHIKEDYSGHYLFDTGFVGSIPKGLNIENYKMASSTSVMPSMYSRWSKRGEPLRNETNQVFPRMRGSRSLALKIERTPKYWRGAFYRDPSGIDGFIPTNVDLETGIGQEFSDHDEFLRAAYLTIEVYKDSSPRFSEKDTTYIGLYL